MCCVKLYIRCSFFNFLNTFLIVLKTTILFILFYFINTCLIKLTINEHFSFFYTISLFLETPGYGFLLIFYLICFSFSFYKNNFFSFFVLYFLSTITFFFSDTLLLNSFFGLNLKNALLLNTLNLLHPVMVYFTIFSYIFLTLTLIYFFFFKYRINSFFFFFQL